MGAAAVELLTAVRNQPMDNRMGGRVRVRQELLSTTSSVLAIGGKKGANICINTSTIIVAPFHEH
eukprot:6745287-Lingulodinium_polyedra.AAC.1